MKKFTKKICSIFIILILCVAGISMSGLAYAETTEEDYAKVWVNDLAGFTHSGATYNNTTNSVDNLVSGGRFGYNSGFENVEVASIVNFSNIAGGHVNFLLRLEGDVPNANYTRLGYQFRWYSHGQYEFLKNGANVIGPAWGPLPAPATGVDYTVVFSTINMSDGSVKVKATVNGAQFFEYIDLTDPILGAGQFVVITDGFTLSARGNGFTEQAINIGDVSTPETNANFPGTTINADGSVDITSGGVTSGAGWAFQQTDFYTYKFNWTPATVNGKLRMTIGSQGTLHRDDIIASGAWTDTGYVLQWWGDNGQRHLYRNNVLLEFVWNLPTFVAGQTYTIEYGVTPFGDGSNRIHLKINGVIYVNFYDRPTEGYTPLTFAKSGAPHSLVRYAVISGIATGKISPCESTVQYDEKTLLTSDLGEPANFSDATFDRNGGISSISGGRNAGYNGNFKNTIVRFKGNFTSVGSMVLQLRGQSAVFDTPWGGSWTNKGYVIYLFSNGQAILSKNGVALCEGWSLSSKGLTTNTDYVIEFGTVNVTDTAVRVFATIDGSPVINYVDTVDALNNAGWFTIFNNAGFAGTLMPYGVEYPVITTNLQDGEKAITNTPVTLGYTLTDKDESDDVTYHVDADKSTATATISENQLTATSAGNLVVYACVNGIYSNDITIVAEKPATPEIINAPSTILFGSANVTIDAKMSDSSAITTKVFGVTNVSGEATINETTGEITPVKAGTVKVFATVNGVKTEEVSITILPVITVNELSSSIIKGQTATMQYTVNCPLPEETITATWEIVTGNDVATVNATSGVVSTINVGQFSIKVTLIGETFSAQSTAINCAVIAPILIDLPTEPIIVGGAKISIDAKMSDDSAIISKTFGVVNVSGEATINETTGEITALKAGTVKVFATVNGAKTEEYLITVIPKVFINKVGSFAFGGRYDMNMFYGANCDLPNEEIVVLFEIVSGGEFATLDATTGILTVGSNPGIVGLKVYVTGETFQAVSAVTNISIEKPIVIVQNDFLGDLYVGQSVTLSPSISQGGVTVESAEIITVSGGDCVTINGMTITAIKEGTFKYKIKVNNTLFDDDEGLEIAIEKLIPTIIANDEMFINKTEQAEVMFNADYTYTSVVWSVVSGQDCISINENGQFTSKKAGTATIKAVIDNIYEATIEITVLDKVSLSGVANNSQVWVGSSIQLSYEVDEDVVGEIESVEYVVLSGADCVTLSNSGELTILKVGKVEIKVVVNGIDSQMITLNLVSDATNNDSGDGNDSTNNDGNSSLWIIIGAVGGALLLGGAVTGIVIFKKRAKKKANYNKENDNEKVE